jgi:hypothetical protein
MGRDTVFSEDLVIDEEAFTKAILDFAELGKQMQKLREDLEDMMNTLRKGFDTPAGTKFIKSCEKKLFQPIDDQKKVLEHITTTLQESKQAYVSVFREYEQLQTTIKNL